MRYVEQTFSTTFVSTVGIDFKYKILDLDGTKVRLEIWDTAGQERFKSITTSYLRGAQGILVCYDVTDRKSFTRVDTWLHDIQQHAELHVDCVLVGLKCDLESSRTVLQEEGKSLAEAHGMPFFEASAKATVGVNAPFERLARSVVDRIRQQQEGSGGGGGGGGRIPSSVIKMQDPNLDHGGGANGSGGGGCCWSS